VLSIGSLIASESVSVGQDIEGQPNQTRLVEMSWKYFQNAASDLNDLLFEDHELMAVQAIIGMVLLPKFARALYCY
jgi:hypothetical protein